MNYFTFQSNTQGSDKENPKIVKFFPTTLTPYPITTYLFSVSSVPSVANAFFNPNAHLRPIIGRHYIPMLYEIKFNENKKNRETCPP